MASFDELRATCNALLDKYAELLAHEKACGEKVEAAELYVVRAETVRALSQLAEQICLDIPPYRTPPLK